MSWRTWLGVDEQRETGDTFTERLIQARVDAAGRAIDPLALGAVEAAAGLWGRAFAAAESDRLTAPVLGRIGRALLLRGEAVWVYVDGKYYEASSWDIRGREDWVYRCNLPMPSGQRTVDADESAVIHPRINQDPSRPWKGISPVTGATNTATLAIAIESSLSSEYGGPIGHILPVPSIGSSTAEGEDEVNPLQNDINNLHGGVVVAETTSGGYGEGRGAAPQKDWVAERIGPNPPEVARGIRTDVERSILAACGVPAELVNPGNESASREGWRRFIFGTIQPVARIVADEVKRKRGGNGMITFRQLAASDLQGRARSYAALRKAEMPDAIAREICGF